LLGKFGEVRSPNASNIVIFPTDAFDQLQFAATTGEFLHTFTIKAVSPSASIRQLIHKALVQAVTFIVARLSGAKPFNLR
jgi:hypothetical protein